VFWPVQIADLFVSPPRRLAVEPPSSSFLDLDDLSSPRTSARNVRSAPLPSTH